MNLTNQIPQNDAVDGAFDRAGALGQSQSVEDSGVVAADAADETVQVRQIVVLDATHPVI